MSYREKIMNFSLDDDGVNRWEFSHYVSMPGGACAACGHHPITHHYFVKHPEKGVHPIGSECISKVLGENAQSAIKAIFQRETREFNNQLKAIWILSQYEGYFRMHPEVLNVSANAGKDHMVVTGRSILSDAHTIQFKNYKDFYVLDHVRYFNKYNEHGIEIPVIKPRNLSKHTLDEIELEKRSERINNALKGLKGE